MEYLKFIQKCISDCEREIEEYEKILKSSVIEINKLRDVKEFLADCKGELKTLKMREKKEKERAINDN